MRQTYPDYRALGEKLPHRSYAALRGRARDLGVQTPRALWTAADVSKLGRLWGSEATNAEIAAALPRFSKEAIKSQAKLMRFRRPYVGQRPTGDPFIDAVKAQAVRRRVTNRQLDKLVGTYDYFYRSSADLAVRHFVLAAEALGGTVTIVWDD